MNIFVGCGSRDGKNKEYLESATKFGEFIAKTNNNLVFGGCPYGLMGAVYTPVSKSNTSKIYVTSVEVYKDDIKTLKYESATISKNIDCRKNAFLNISDAFVFLPGGLGSIDEIMTCIETKRGKEHNKPIIIININGYYNELLATFDKLFKEDFADPKCKELFKVVDTVDKTIEILK